jgi:hypothetical protein
MRGVYLPPGSHIVEFKFQPPHSLLYVSAAADFAALAGLAIFIGQTIKSKSPVPVPPAPAAPAPPAMPATSPIKSNKSATGSRKKLQRK